MQTKSNTAEMASVTPEGAHWDAFTQKHLEAWVDDQFGARDEAEEKLAIITRFLNAQDVADLNYWFSKSWFDVLTYAEHDAKYL